MKLKVVGLLAFAFIFSFSGLLTAQDEDTTWVEYQYKQPIWDYSQDSTFYLELWVEANTSIKAFVFPIEVDRLLYRLDSATINPSAPFTVGTATFNDFYNFDDFAGQDTENHNWCRFGAIYFLGVDPAFPGDNKFLFGTLYMTFISDSLGALHPSIPIDFMMDSVSVPPAAYVKSDPGNGYSEIIVTNDGAGVILDVKEIKQGVIPTDYELAQNYPNPFNPTTVIEFGLPSKSHVELDIYNIMGQKVRTLVNEELDVGWKSVTWDGTSDSGREVASGVYLYKLKAGDVLLTKKMMMLK